MSRIYRGRPTKTIPSSSSVSFSLRRMLPSEVTSECGVAGLSSTTSRGCGTATSPVVKTGGISFGVEGASPTEISFSGFDIETVSVSEGVSGGGGAFGSDISRNTWSICSRTRLARSPTSAVVKPSVETGGSTDRFYDCQKSVPHTMEGTAVAPLTRKVPELK